VYFNKTAIPDSLGKLVFRVKNRYELLEGYNNSISHQYHQKDRCLSKELAIQSNH
jgi:hypothetical protein